MQQFDFAVAPEDMLLDLENVFSEIEPFEYSLPDKHDPSEPETQFIGSNLTRKRSFSFVAEDVSSCPSPVDDETYNPASDTNNMDRVERKKSREKKRRVEVNQKFDELNSLLITVENGLAAARAQATGGQVAPPKATPGNRVELLSRAVRVMRKLWTDRQSGHSTASAAGATLPRPISAGVDSSSSSSAPPLLPTGMTPAMMQAHHAQFAAHFQQQQQQQQLAANSSGSGNSSNSNSTPAPMMNMGSMSLNMQASMQAMMAAAARNASAGGSSSNSKGGMPAAAAGVRPNPAMMQGPGNMPLMMMMPMFMPQPQSTGAQNGAISSRSNAATPKSEFAAGVDVPVPVHKPMGAVKDGAAGACSADFKHAAARHGMFFAPPALPQFVTAALDEDAPTEAATHAVCA